MTEEYYIGNWSHRHCANMQIWKEKKSSLVDGNLSGCFDSLSLMMFEKLINICSSTLSMPDCLIYRINKFRLLLMYSSTRHIYSMHEAEKGDENGKCLHAEWFVNRKTHISSFCSFPSRGLSWDEENFRFIFLFFMLLLLLVHLPRDSHSPAAADAWMDSMENTRTEKESLEFDSHFPRTWTAFTYHDLSNLSLWYMCARFRVVSEYMCKTRKGIIERWWWHNTAKKKEKRIHIVQCLFVQIQHLFVWVKQQIYFVILFLPFPSPQLSHPAPTPPLALSCVYDISIFSTAVCCPNDNKQKWTFQFVGGRAFRVSSQGKIHLTHTTRFEPPSDIDKRRTNDDKGIGKSERECGKRKGKYFCWCLCVLDFSPFSDEWRENEELIEGWGRGRSKKDRKMSSSSKGKHKGGGENNNKKKRKRKESRNENWTWQIVCWVKWQYERCWTSTERKDEKEFHEFSLSPSPVLRVILFFLAVFAISRLVFLCLQWK